MENTKKYSGEYFFLVLIFHCKSFGCICEQGILKVTAETLSQLDSQFSMLPEEQRKAIRWVLENPPKAQVDQTLADGEELPFCGGITVIQMPGHTLGHICLYLQESKTLIAGDAMCIIDGQLQGPIPQFAYDSDLASKSLAKLTQYDIAQVVCYHGGLFEDNPNQRILELVNG